MALLKVRDECTKLVGHRFLNSHICLVISIAQLAVCCWAVAQHINSYVYYRKILKCDFLEGSLPLEAVDAVIFDIRLFHYLWGIRGCVAEYLDGGFGRLAWCVSHSTSLIFSMPATFAAHPKPFYFYPLLVQQSAYGICLLVLLLAALPRIVVALASPHAAPLIPILFYFIGTALNFFHLYVYWHWYWHVTAMWNSAVRVKFGQRLVNANNRSRRDKPRAPTVAIDDAVLHYVPGTPIINEPKLILPLPTAIATRPVDDGDEADVDDDDDDDEDDARPTPPPPIYATKLSANSIENRGLREQRRRRRRRLPATPDLPAHGEVPRPIFYIPHARV
ncbi:unnamed protein product [Caenorhabditis bovis]|uniref:Uncharacterized protein n=1 Tax=Caenorhabditis bovis TaxID=2654633 RepID=A0A8S1FD49_9PELO|nr:unnamed protein product [Caenorhabditis bovis]